MVEPNKIVVPQPDPTELTTAQLTREIEGLAARLERQLSAQERLMGEKFLSVKDKLDLVEKQRVELKLDTATAVQAALAAAKEAVSAQAESFKESVAKSEAATAKQLDQIQAALKAEIKGVTDLLYDLKDRVGKMEAVRIGGQESKTNVYAAIGIAATIIGVLLAVFAFATP